MKTIKHKIRDVIVLLVLLSGVSWLYRSIIQTKRPLVRVLCFHDVQSALWFENVLILLKRRFFVVTPKQFHDGDFDKVKINILLTFDDGYQSWLDVCLPVLEKHGCKGLFFINSGLLDCAGDIEKVKQYMTNRLLISAKNTLTWEGARKLVKHGHTIGGHTVNHQSLAKLREGEIYKEVVEDKNRIEKLLGLTLIDFAYPFGTKHDFSNQTIQQTTRAGYTYQYSGISGFSSIKKTLFPRTLIEENSSIFSIRTWVMGCYDVFLWLKN